MSVGSEHRRQAGGWAPTASRIARTTWLSGKVASISRSAIPRSRGSTSWTSAWNRRNSRADLPNGLFVLAASRRVRTSTGALSRMM